MFTFVVITYNHEAYILEHLESIRYQILHYGEERSVSIVISDDGSSDITLLKVEQWLSVYGGLFSSVQILTSAENKGIVANYIRGVQAVQTEDFKVLGGDDLYNRHNIFDVLGEKDVLFSPVVPFCEDEVINEINWTTLLLMKYGALPRAMKHWLGFFYFIPSPGAFLTLELARDEGMLSFVSQYRWVEDYAKWWYIFHEKEDLDLGYASVPLVLYRRDSGISKNAGHGKHSPFKEEEKRFFKEQKVKGYRYPKWINPYRQYMRMVRWKLLHVDVCKDPIVKERLECYSKEMRDAQGYLEEIRSRARAFENSMTKDVGHGAADSLGEARK